MALRRLVPPASGEQQHDGDDDEHSSLPDRDLRGHAFRRAMRGQRKRALWSLCENSTYQIAVECKGPKLAAIQPRSGGCDVSPGRKPRVKWEILASRGSGDRVLTHTP